MTFELKEIIRICESLSEEEQKQLVHLLHQGLLWDDAFKNSQDQLALLAEEALTEYKEVNASQGI